MSDGPNALNEKKFESRLDSLVEVVRGDEDLSICEIIGVLECKKLSLFQEIMEDLDDEEF